MNYVVSIIKVFSVFRTYMSMIVVWSQKLINHPRIFCVFKNKRRRLFGALLIITASSLSAQTPLLLKGVLLDTVFAKSDSITAEVLESQQRFPVAYGKPFTISLPPDSTWNICIRDKVVEQCYEIVRSEGPDVVIDSLTNSNRLQVFSQFNTALPLTDSAASPIGIPADSSNTPAVAGDPDILTKLRPVVITVRKRPVRSLGQSTVSSKAISRQPGLAEADVIKSIQALPGVVSSSDFSSKIYVRGGGADQNLFLFDNGVVYSPVHFFGLFSTFLVDGVDKVDFYKGGFSPSYGNRLSSVVDVSSRKGGRAENDTLFFKGSAQISTFATTVSMEGSKNGTQVQASGRTTYIKEALDGLRAAGVTDLAIDYRFYDIQGNLFQKLSGRQGLQISWYTGKDDLVFSPLATFWGNTVIPLNYFFSIKEGLDLRATLAYSAFNQEFGIERIQTFSNKISSIGAKSQISCSLYEPHFLVAGFESQFFETLFGNSSDFINLSNESNAKFAIHSLFAEDKYTRGPCEIIPAVRLNYLTTLAALYAEPRLGIRFSPGEDQRIDLHAGYYRQFINSVIFGDAESINEFYYPAGKERTQHIEPASSLLFSLGYFRDNLFGQWNAGWEVYYKSLENLIVFAPDEKPDSIRNKPNTGLGDLFILGNGYSLGTELSVRRNEGALSGGFSYALGYSVQQEGESAFFAKWDIPHAFKMDAGIVWRDRSGSTLFKSKRTFLRSSLQFKYTSGLPLTEITGYLPTHFINQGKGQQPGGPTPSLDGNLATPLGGRNNSRYPAYSRFDIKAIEWGRTDAWEFNWTILNIFNRPNVFLYTYDNSVNPPTRTTIPQFPFFPVLLSYRRYF
jgi:hypothetical protein